MSDSILQKTDEPKCFITGSYVNLDRHHVINGAMRSWAEEQGLWIYVQHDIHMWLHSTGDGKKTMMKLKKFAQQKWEEVHSNDYDDVHEEWMKKVRVNYL